MNKRNRKYIRTVILLIMVAAVAYTLYLSINSEQAVIQEGDMAPNFQLETLQGETVKLNDYRGKGVFLNFWGTWCKPCEKEMP